MERRLAAILAFDVAGYSRLMEQDETGTHSAFRSHRKELIEPRIGRFSGRIVRLAGDGALIDFSSAVDAVECAVEIQRGLAERNSPVPEDRRIEMRIGINLGDIIIEEDDIFGDGVNVAARLESLAEPGSIYVSGSVHEQVHGKLPLIFDDLGEFTVKNISRPIHVYCPQLYGKESVANGGPGSGSRGGLRPIPSVAVLPLENKSDDPKQDTFCDGFTEDVTTELSRFRSLSVIAHASSYAYGGAGRYVNPKQVSRELGVEYVVKGSIRRLGARMRITVQLADCKTGKDLWAERYDRGTEEIFLVQDEVISEIVGALESRVVHERLSLAKHTPLKNLKAYDYWLEGKKLTELFAAEADNEAISLFERAIKLDPTFARAYASLALIFNSKNLLAPGDPNNEENLAMGLGHAKKAVFLDPLDARNHVDIGWSYMLRRDFTSGRRHFGLAGQLNPNDANITIARGLASAFLGDAEKGLLLAQKAIRLNPFHPDYYFGYLATIQFLAERYDEAVATIDLAPDVWPESAAWYAAACAHLGRIGRAKKAAGNFLADVSAKWIGDPNATPADYVRWLLQANSIRRYEDIQRLLEGLGKAGLPQVENPGLVS